MSPRTHRSGTALGATASPAVRLVVGTALLFGLGCSSFAPRAEMSEGQKMYLSKCTSCHAAYEPHQYTPKQWSEAIAEMEADKRIELTDGDRQLIMGYLVGAPDPTSVVAPPAQPALSDNKQ